MAKQTVAQLGSQIITIPAPDLRMVEFVIVGTAPYVMNKFSQKAKTAMAEKQSEGSTSQKGKKRTARDFDQDYEQCQYKTDEGWTGFHAGGLRQAMIRACSLVDFKMTLAKLSIFVIADGFDNDEGIPLIRLYGNPKKVQHMVRNATGVADIRVRAMFNTWYSRLRIRYDADQFTETDVANLVLRAGEQVGLGEGRPSSKQSAGMGWGTFRIAGKDEQAALQF
jgi:hypothetical protein